jgi:hypothetical protein
MLISIDLTTEEHEILKDILESDLTELRSEITHCDSHDFKMMLKDRKAAVNKVLGALEEDK